MRRFGLFAIVGILGLTLVGCERAQVKQDEGKPPIQAPGIDQLQGFMQKADVFYQTQDYSKARDLYAQVVQLDPKNLKATYRLGNIAFRGRKWTEALKHYQAVIAIEPRHTRAQYNLSMTYLTLAERHLKFYAANVDSNANLDSVSRLVTALEEISNPGAAQQRATRRNGGADSDTSSSLDKLLDELSR